MQASPSVPSLITFLNLISPCRVMITVNHRWVADAQGLERALKEQIYKYNDMQKALQLL